MAYQYQTGTANDLPHWFSLLETFLTTVGWTIESGAGSTEIVFSSIGEGGGRTKLFIRYSRRTGIWAGWVYHRVQDDAAGTHTTTDGSFADQIIAPGLGAIPFEYWMAADKDKVIVNFKAGAGYTGCYTGLVEPFALSVDEEQQMVALALHENIPPDHMGYVLKDVAGNWNQSIQGGQLTNDYIKDPLDNSVAIFGLRVHEGTTTSFNKIVGQPTDVSGAIAYLPGLNPEDIITTGYTGATSTWIVMGTGMRWCMRTGGVVPVGQLEGAHFAHTNGLATSQADFESKILAFMTAVGWTKVANPSPVYPIDYFWYSQGENGTEDIYLRWHYRNVNTYQITVADDTALSHETTSDSIGILPDDFPTYYYITADRDCLLVVLEIAGVFDYFWAGMYQMFLPDPDSYATPYKVGLRFRILRDHDGNWDQSIGSWPDAYLNSSPNLYDGVTNIVWQYTVQSAKVPIGVCKYMHRLSGPGISNMDTVAIGGRSFRYFYGGTGYYLAFREA